MYDKTFCRFSKLTAHLSRIMPETSGNFLHNLRQHCLLFYCYRLRQISWLIHILPFANGYMVGQ